MNMHRLLLLILALGWALPARGGETFLTKDEALELAFEGCEVTRSTVTLSKEQKAAIAKLTGQAFDKNLVYPYVATKKGKVVGTAWFDVHKVRTLRETLMIVVSPEGKIDRLELLAFGEPTEYIPRDKWYAQLDNKSLADPISLKKDIKPVTGATLTAKATTLAARRTLALHKVWLDSLEDDEEEKKPEEKKPEEKKPGDDKAKPKPTDKRKGPKKGTGGPGDGAALALACPLPW